MKEVIKYFMDKKILLSPEIISEIEENYSDLIDEKNY